METWRVVDDAGKVHEASVAREDDGVWYAKFTAEPSWPNGFGFNARTAVLRVCDAVGAVEIVAPGALTAAEKVQAEQDRCVRITDIAMADAERHHHAAGDRRDWDAVQETEGAQNAIARVRLSIREGQ